MDEMRGGDVLPAGTRLEEFEIERELGAGGFGVTYLAHDTSLDRQVAIKEYLPQACGTRRPDGGVGPRSASQEKNYSWGFDRFLKEARILARLRHPNVVQVHQVIEARGTAYMVTEYVEGRSLAEALQADGPWPAPRVLALLDALTSGLGPVHAAGLVHRDIKPANVMLRGDGSPVLIDFGAARQAMGRQSRSVTAVLTPGYAPFEQYNTKGRQGPWTDVYALGAVAYEALSGRVPEEAPARMEDDTLRPVAEVAAHGVSPGCAAAIGAALALRGPDRPQSLAEWRSRLGLPAAGQGHARPGHGASVRQRNGRAGAGHPGRARSGARRMDGGASADGDGGATAETSGSGTGGTAERPPVPPPPEVGPAGSSRRWRLAGAAALVLVALAGAGLAWRTAEEERTAAAEADRRRAAAAAAEAERQRLAELRRPGPVFRDCDTCPEMVVIPAGTFMMGSPASEERRFDDEGPRHEVTLRPFALGVKEVTFDEWDACVRGGGCDGYRPDDEGWGRGARPVINVNWEDAQAYVSWLSERTGSAYRLPSESEWEYAARAGTTTPFHTGSMIFSTNQANYNGYFYRPWGWGFYRMRTMPAGEYAPNAFGLYDVHGNVWEWVKDCWHDDYGGAPSDGRAWTRGGDCGRRVLRGGSWNNSPWLLRSANRLRGTPGRRDAFSGFRVSRTLD